MNGSSASIAEAMTLGYTARPSATLGHDNQDRIDRQKGLGDAQAFIGRIVQRAFEPLLRGRHGR